MVLIPALISFFIVFLLTINFEPFVSWKGGGVNHMISKLIFKNNIYFYLNHNQLLYSDWKIQWQEATPHNLAQ